MSLTDIIRADVRWRTCSKNDESKSLLYLYYLILIFIIFIIFRTFKVHFFLQPIHVGANCDKNWRKMFRTWFRAYSKIIFSLSHRHFGNVKWTSKRFYPKKRFQLQSIYSNPTDTSKALLNHPIKYSIFKYQVHIKVSRVVGLQTHYISSQRFGLQNIKPFMECQLAPQELYNRGPLLTACTDRLTGTFNHQSKIRPPHKNSRKINMQ